MHLVEAVLKAPPNAPSVFLVGRCANRPQRILVMGDNPFEDDRRNNQVSESSQERKILRQTSSTIFRSRSEAFFLVDDFAEKPQTDDR